MTDQEHVVRQRRQLSLLTRCVAVTAAIALLAAPLSAGKARAVSAPDSERLHWTGLPLVGPEVNQIAPRDEVQAMAVSAALDFAMAHPRDVAYPWLDESEEVIQLSAASDIGADLLQAERAALPTPHTVRRVSRSLATLDQIAYDVTRIAAEDVDGGSLIFRTEPDWANNRIIVTVRAEHDALFQLLADRFGTEAVAIRVAPDEPVLKRHDSRQTDVTPFTGGANLVAPLGCSDAFSWKNSVYWQGMLTAGHCAYTVSAEVKTTANEAIGRVEFENWQFSIGTVPFWWETDPPVFRGDIALVKAYADKHTTAWIFRGGIHSTVGDPVTGGLNRWVLVNDPYCVSAAESGDSCGGFEVDAVGVNEMYEGGDWILNAVRGSKFNTSACPIPGDSGGAVFVQDGSGGVKAMGIHSGGEAIGPSCITIFTDIRHAITALPGTIKWK